MQQQQSALDPLAIKLVIVGDGSVGKTCILVTYTTDKFPAEYVPTIFENYSAQIKVDDKMIILSLWDTAGQEEYNKLRQISYPQSDVFIITFSVAEKATFDNAVKKWYPELQEQMPHVPKIFIGNKIDIRKENDKCVPFHIAQRVISEIGCKYLECSALTQEGLKIAFDEAIRIVLKKRAAPKIQDNSKSQRSKATDPDKEDRSGNLCHIM